MSNTSYDVWLDKLIDDYWDEVEQDLEIPWPDEPEVEPNTDYDNYDGWDDMQ